MAKEVYYWTLRVKDSKTQSWKSSKQYTSFAALAAAVGPYLDQHPSIAFQFDRRKAWIEEK